MMVSARAARTATVFIIVALAAADCAFGPHAQPEPRVISDQPIPNPPSKKAVTSEERSRAAQQDELKKHLQRVKDQINALQDQIKTLEGESAK